ncbi:MAG: hypothetical protein K1X28_09150 [Parachlamydiales bacterium]|nr:hypothetical protein [Parachlamydiales bacterium]
MFNENIVRWNILETPTNIIDAFFREHPLVFKVALFANHLFRALAMSFMMLCFSPTICFAGSLFYRLTVEKNCAFKFALPALGGGISFLMSEAGLASVVSGIAFSSLERLGESLISLIPLGMYLSYVILTVDYEVDNRPCDHCVDV